LHTTWTYKDVGIMGWIALDPESEYIQLIAPELTHKCELDTDFWMGWLPSTPFKQTIETLVSQIEETLADPTLDWSANRQYLRQAIGDHYIGQLLQPSFARRFKGMSETELDHVLESFTLGQCKLHIELLKIIQRHTARPHVDEAHTPHALQ